MKIRITLIALLGLALAGCSRGPRWTTDAQIARLVDRVDASRIESDIHTLVGFGTRSTLSDPDDPARGIGAARRWLKSQFEQISAENEGRLIVTLDGYHQEPDGRRIVKPVDILNVVATLPGVQAESASRVYVVSGHYDSIPSDPTDFESDAPGADDDGSGVAAVLEMARVMAKEEFDATIVFMAVAGEEQGLFGSTYAAKRFRDDGIHVAGMMTNDIIGSSTGVDGTRERGRVRVFSEGAPLEETSEQALIRYRSGSENDSPSRQLARYADRACDAYVRGLDVHLIFRQDRYSRGGDHKPFAAAGFPAIRLTEFAENYAHQHQDVRVENGMQYGDLPEFLDFGYIADVARVNVATLASLARAPASPKNVSILTDRLSNDTTLRWDANTEPDLAGYEILWRDTTAPQWEHGVDVGDVAEHTMPLSKDNYVFGVCAVDAEGHRSPAVLPIPTRR